jgi:hypothetical protein
MPFDRERITDLQGRVEACGPTAVPPYEEQCQGILRLLGWLD